MEYLQRCVRAGKKRSGRYGLPDTHPDDLKPYMDETGEIWVKVFPLEVAAKVPQLIRTCLISWSIMIILSILMVFRHPDYDKP